MCCFFFLLCSVIINDDEKEEVEELDEEICLFYFILILIYFIQNTQHSMITLNCNICCFSFLLYFTECVLFVMCVHLLFFFFLNHIFIHKQHEEYERKIRCIESKKKVAHTNLIIEIMNHTPYIITVLFQSLFCVTKYFLIICICYLSSPFYVYCLSHFI